MSGLQHHPLIFAAKSERIEFCLHRRLLKWSRFLMDICVAASSSAVRKPHFVGDVGFVRAGRPVGHVRTGRPGGLAVRDDAAAGPGPAPPGHDALVRRPPGSPQVEHERRLERWQPEALLVQPVPRLASNLRRQRAPVRGRERLKSKWIPSLFGTRCTLWG